MAPRRRVSSATAKTCSRTFEIVVRSHPQAIPRVQGKANIAMNSGPRPTSSATMTKLVSQTTKATRMPTMETNQ